VRGYLGFEDTDPNEIEVYRQTLDFKKGVSKKYLRFHLDMLSTKPEYMSWQTANQSHLLLLRGHSIKTGSDLSWLSPAAFSMLNQLRTEPGNIITRCFVQTRPWMQENLAAYKVFSRIIIQLLEEKPDLVRDVSRLEKLKQRAQSTDWKRAEPKLPCEILGLLLADIPVTYIILDRIDRCRCSPVVLVNQLLQLVRECKTVVKIFAILGEIEQLDLKALDTEGVEDCFQVITLDQIKHKANSKIEI
jgi:hypothetical protein